MQYDEKTEGAYRIHAGAMESPPGGGYIAAVVISRVAGHGRAIREAWRDMNLASGHEWPSPRDALLYAVAKAQEVIRTESHCLSC